MARPAAKELTERELEIMHQYWKLGETTIADIREALLASGTDLAYTTVATLVRILTDKGFLEQTTTERPFKHKPLRSFEDVSNSLVGDMLDRVFLGSPEGLLKCLFGPEKLSSKDKAKLIEILKEKQ